MKPSGEKRDQPRLVVIAGPTGVGKTALALALAKEFAAEIISADSMQVYRYLDIGTAKPTAAERRLVPHHLLDCVDPDEEYHAARFREEARQVIAALHERGKNIFVVGGTGLYIRVLLGGLLPGPGADGSLRNHYRNLAARGGREHLHNLLRRRDPAAAGAIAVNDTVRVIRALEYLKATGRSITAGQAAHRFGENSYKLLRIGLNTGREELFELIARRADAMLAAGLVDETRAIVARGFTGEIKPLQSLGYKHIRAYLDGRCSLAEAREMMIRDTRHYAKRQLTWFRGEPEMRWHGRGEGDRIATLIKEFLAP